MTKLAVEFGVGKATISDLKTNHAKMQQSSNGANGKTLKQCHNVTVTANENIDKAFFFMVLKSDKNDILV